MNSTITEAGEEYFFDQLSIPPKFDEPALATRLGLPIDDDRDRKVREYDLFFQQPIALNALALHRSVFDLFLEESCHRTPGEIQAKVDELWTHADTREEAIAADVLYWALYEDADWVLDEWIEQSKQLSEED